MRRRRQKQKTFHDRVPLTDDFEVVPSREGFLSSTGHSDFSQRSPAKGRSGWTRGTHWELPVGEEADDEGISDDRISIQMDSEMSDAVSEAESAALEEHVNVWVDEEHSQYEPMDPIPETGLKGKGKKRKRKSWAAEWDGEQFQKTSLKAIGHTVQLNHMGRDCIKPVSCHSKLRILHTNGIHHISLLFCGCSKKIPQYQQLLRRGLYPATVTEGRIMTWATFTLLRTIHMQSFTTKASTHDFYRALEKLTDNTRLDLPKSRYRLLLCIIRQWRHLKMLMWSGLGHNNEFSPGPVQAGKKSLRKGLEGAEAAGETLQQVQRVEEGFEGSLVIKCPTCPHPGINLPDGWELEARSFLYRLCVCIDGNFRLKEQLVSSHSRDPALNDGMGYFVRRVPYEKWTLSKGDEDVINTCVPLAALAKQNTKFSKGLRYTGVVGVACGRSEMFLRLANLHKGERYSSSDYVFAKALVDFLRLLHLLVIYDVACQWFVNLLARLKLLAVHMRVEQPTLKMVPGIGKLHEPGHKQKNHEQYSLNYIPGAGNIDGEVMERIWGEHNNLGNATKTMGPGSREDYIDATAGDWNWQKYVGIGLMLTRRYWEAVKDRAKHVSEHAGLTANLDKEMVERWEQMCVAWENAPTPKSDVMNPFAISEEFISTNKALEELAWEEEARMRAGGVQYHAIDAAGFLVLALEIKDTQYKLRQKTESQQRSPTAKQSRKRADELRAYEELCPIYMPGLVRYLEKTGATEDSSELLPENVTIWLPSDIPVEHLPAVCVEKLAGMEARIQFARCHDALHGLRHALRVKTCMMLFKNVNIRGQRDSHRTWDTINRVVAKIQRYASNYRSSRRAYHHHMGPGDWENTLRVLNNEDIHSYRDHATVRQGPGQRGTNEEYEGEEDDMESPLTVTEPGLITAQSLIAIDRTEWDHRTVHGTGETRKGYSWIWYAGRKIDVRDGADERDNEILRSEWCKSRARANRMTEEVLMLREEMRRGLAYLEWAAKEWDSHAAMAYGSSMDS
ncbi:hypothetical protein VNI00_018883 [Paramarasmius palmivorus]|uniref:CxC2-like cysteine cluster KDZ transposase-associated domain-containing protein n=1 Tax=Paramarasmius palmivorus TaxID=297713 RepID=A0AAW0AUA6_9AGAR